MKKKGTKKVTLDVSGLTFSKSTNSKNAVLIFKSSPSAIENVEGENEMLGYILAKKGTRDAVMTSLETFNTIEFSYSTVKRTYQDKDGNEQDSIKRLTPIATS